MNADLLELELRRLAGVSFVGFLDRPDVTLVQIVAEPDVDLTALRAACEQTVSVHIQKPFVVEMSGGLRPSRVRLLDVGPAADGVPGEVEVHLAYDGMRSIGRAKSGDPAEAALATLDALGRLGAEVPFRVEAAALFEHQVGEGVMLVLNSPSAGQLYGAAAGDSLEKAAVRAALHALNRYLATQVLPAMSSPA